MHVGINAQKLFLTQDYRNAGISRYIERLIRHLPAADPSIRYTIYTNKYVQSWPELESQNVRVVPTPLLPPHPVLRIAWEQTVLPVLAARHGIDLLHCPLNVRPVLSPVPVVLTIHDLTFIRFPDRFHPFKQRYLATFTRYSARQSRVILADSAATKRDVEAAFGIPEERVVVVYPGVDRDFRPLDPQNPVDRDTLRAFRQKHKLPDQMVLYLGTLEPRKNVDRLVDAFARLVARGLPHTLVLAGGKGWQYQAIFEAIERHQLGGRVLVPGYVSREEQPLWYNAASLLVYPSQYEGFGLPPLEALSCGVPVITSNTSSLPEVVGNAGITVDPTDTDALADAMFQVLTNPAQATALRHAGQLQARTFDWAAAARACVMAYHAAVSPVVPVR